MAQQTITADIIAKEAMMQLENNLAMGQCVHRDYKKEWEGVKKGESVRVRRPVKFDVSDGETVTLQDVEEANTNITVNQRKHVAWRFTTQELTLSIEEYSERYIKPAMIALANNVDRALASLYDDVYNWVGTPGQTVDSYSDFSKAPERLDLMAVPADQRHAILDPRDHWAMAGSQTALFFNQIGQPAYRKGEIGEIGKIMTYMDQNIRAHTTGTFTTGSTPLVNGANQNVTYANANKLTYSQTLVTDGWANSTAVLKAGDVFTLASVNAVKPVPGESTKDDAGFLQQFVVLNDVTSDGSGNATLTISPPIITSGPYQTVSAAPADDAAITPLGSEATSTYRQNLVFHKNAFALVMIPLEMPDGVEFKARESHNGYSVRCIKYYDGKNDYEAIRLDILYGVKTLYPDLATRLSGTAAA